MIAVRADEFRPAYVAVPYSLRHVVSQLDTREFSVLVHILGICQLRTAAPRRQEARSRGEWAKARDERLVQRATQRRALMDERTRAHHRQADAEIEAMRGAFGREAEMRRRKVDELVMKLRQVDRYMSHTDALRKVRAQYPGLFG